MPRKPTVRARGLGAELKELRQQAGLTTRKAGELAGWSHATVSRIEVGTRGVTTEEVATLLAIYKVTGDTRERLIQLARDAHLPGWWETGEPGLPPKLTTFIGFEVQATTITDVALVLLPGLLQTADYIRAVMSAAGIPATVAETRVATRLGRQAVLTKPNAPELHVFLDEAVLHRPLGGPRVMREQLEHVLAVGARPNIHLRVMPWTPEGHRALNGAFTMLEFDKAQTLVMLEHRRSCLFLDDPKDVEIFAADLATLEETAMNTSESREFIAECAKRYEGQ